MFSQNGFKMFNVFFHESYSLMFTIWKQFKIFRRIIRFISVFMMDMFPGFKQSSKFLTHYISMFKKIAIFMSHRMIRIIYQHITTIWFNIFSSFFSLISSISFSPSHSCSTRGTIASIIPLNAFNKLFNTKNRSSSPFFAFSTSNKYCSSISIFIRSHCNGIPMNNRPYSFYNFVSNWPIYCFFTHNIKLYHMLNNKSRSM